MIYYIGSTLGLIDDAEHATLAEAYEYLKDKKIIGVDIETSQKYGGKYPNEGLDPYTTNVVMVQIGDLERQYVIDFRHTRTLGKGIKKILESKDYIKVGHNLKFEYKHLYVADNIKLRNIYDTMIAEQVLFNGLPRNYSLKALVSYYLGEEVDKSVRLGFLQIGSRPFTKTEIEYGARDVTDPIEIMHKQRPRINRYGFKACLRLEFLFTLVLGRIELKGMNFNEQHWRELYKDNKQSLEEARLQLEQVVLDNTLNIPNVDKFLDKQLDLFGAEPSTRINWSSSYQVIELFKALGICPMEKSKYTGKTSYTVNAAILKSSLNTTNLKASTEVKDFIKLYLKFKKIEQSCTTFGLKFLNNINPITGRIHSNYKQILNTGRISSSSPNLQNIPHDDRFRKAFDAPKNHKIVNADYSGQEQIILANKSLAPNILKFYREGHTDMHSYIASNIFGKPYEDYIEAKKQIDSGNKFGMHHSARMHERQISKAAGFAINYGGTGYTISKNLGIPATEGDAVYNSYFKAFPGLKDYFKKVQRETVRNKYILIDKITKRKYFIPEVTADNKNSIDRLSLNFPIQGEAGSITKLAAILFVEKVEEATLEPFMAITNLVHDEINVECDDRCVKTAASLLEISMKEAADVWCKTIPLNADAAIVDYWTH